MNNNNHYTHTDEETLSPVVHRTIMRRVAYLKLRPLFIIILFFFAANMIALSSHIGTKLGEAEFMTMVPDFTNTPYIDMLVISVILERFFEIISLELLLSLAFNIAGVLYVASRLLSYKLKARSI